MGAFTSLERKYGTPAGPSQNIAGTSRRRMAINSKYKRRLRDRFVKVQNGLCVYCRRPFTNGGDTQPTIEHKKARMDGGKDHVSNLAAACLHCNAHRGQQMHRVRLKAGQRTRPENATAKSPPQAPV